MILIRNDDVILDSSGKYKGKEFERFRFVHEQICRVPDKLLHCPAILCEEIEAFPQAIEYIREEAKAGRMRPYLHCWNHTDWTTKSRDEIVNMLKQCDLWFDLNLYYEYTVWATPWGANSPVAQQAARELGIRVETTHETVDIKAAARFVQQSGLPSLDGRTVLFHWWERGLSLFRIVEAAAQGSWAAAAAAKPEWFK
jgi:peptidoglycan/xylan/chitin deacetylase (PgdA/CDA1 family)